MQGNLPEYALHLHLFNSQNYEATFRNARALTGTFSSITNFTVQQFLRKSEKLSLLNQMKSSEESSDSPCALKFPKHHKNRGEFSNATASSTNSTISSIDDVEQIIIKAYNFAEQILSDLRIVNNLQKYSLNEINSLSMFVFNYLDKTSKTNDNSSFDNSMDANDTSDDETSDDDGAQEDHISDEDICDEVDSEDESNGALNDVVGQIKTTKTQYYDMRIYDEIDSSNLKHYFKININNQVKFVHKQTATRILTKDKN